MHKMKLVLKKSFEETFLPALQRGIVIKGSFFHFILAIIKSNVQTGKKDKDEPNGFNDAAIALYQR